jgi:hypothetical protein
MRYPFDLKRLKYKTKTLRRSAIASLILILVTSPWTAEWALKNWIESYASTLNGAEVNIGKLSFSLWRGTAKLENIQITHHTQPLENLFAVHSVELQFDRLALLQSRLWIPSMKVNGIEFRSRREQSGFTVAERANSLEPTPLLDRLRPGAFSDALSQWGELPLKTIATLSLGQSGHFVTDAVRSQLPSVQALIKLEQSLEDRAVRWERHLQAYSKPQAAPSDFSPANRIQQLGKLREEVLSESKELASEGTRLGQSLPQDIHHLFKGAGFSLPENGDLTGELFGKRAVGYLERIAYWVEVSRRHQDFAPMIAATGAPTSLAPTIQIDEITFLSTASEKPSQGTITGTMEGLTSYPVGRKRPLFGNFDIAFPGLGIGNVKLDFLVDHTTSQPREEANLEVASAISDWRIEQQPEIQWKVSGGAAAITIKVRSAEKELHSSWKIRVAYPKFEITSKSEDLVRSLRSVHCETLEIGGNASGAFSKPKIEISSNFGIPVATALQRDFRSTLESNQESIRQSLVSSFEPRLTRLMQRSEQYRDSMIEKIKGSTDAWNRNQASR